METKKKEINYQVLESVTGGDGKEMADIIGLFRKYGFEKEARTLEKGGSPFFEVSFKNILKDLGYTHKLNVYVNDDNVNMNTYNGSLINHFTLMDTLEEFLYRKANNIDFM